MPKPNGMRNPIFKIRKKTGKEYSIKDRSILEKKTKESANLKQVFREFTFKNKKNPSDYYKYVFTDDKIISYTSKGKKIIHNNPGLLKELYEIVSKDKLNKEIILKNGTKLFVTKLKPNHGISHKRILKVSLSEKGKVPFDIFLKENYFDWNEHKSNKFINASFTAKMEELQPHREIFAQNYLEKLGFNVIKPLFGITDEKHELNYTAYPFVYDMRTVADVFDKLDRTTYYQLESIEKSLNKKYIFGLDQDDIFCKKVGEKNGRPVYNFYIFDQYFDYDRHIQSLPNAILEALTGKRTGRK